MGMFDQMKEAMKMRSEAKRIEAEIKKITPNIRTAASPSSPRAI
jgi:hypothetical protein